MDAAAPVRVDNDADYVLTFSDVEVNLDRNAVTRHGRRVALTGPEYSLLALFLLNPGRDLTRDTILDSVWSYLATPNTRTVDVHVLRLRKKLEDDPDAPRHFLTIHRVGYRFEP
ncbi:MAG TPA: winged helix-turn-helix domain-containing protein [Bryobacteraceae bacterium]|nr:winged helix-turn-helix domain-containing protein [Bryobacteraceae bacterium]